MRTSQQPEYHGPDIWSSSVKYILSIEQLSNSILRKTCCRKIDQNQHGFIIYTNFIDLKSLILHAKKVSEGFMGMIMDHLS